VIVPVTVSVSISWAASLASVNESMQIGSQIYDQTWTTLKFGNIIIFNKDNQSSIANPILYQYNLTAGIHLLSAWCALRVFSNNGSGGSMVQANQTITILPNV
jgi:hypothetical protein